MIEKIRHYALTNFPAIHDEEAYTALELMGRIGHKTNECIQAVNDATEKVDNTVVNLPGMIDNAVKGFTGGELDKFYEEANRIIDNLPEGGANVRPGAVDNGSIVSGMLGGDLLGLRENHYINMAGKWNGGNGYYDETLTFVDHSGYAVSDLIPVKYGQYWKVDTAIFGNKVYPVALFNSQLRCIAVLGAIGEDSWDFVTHDIMIDRGDAAYMRVICGTGQVSEMRVEYYTMNSISLNETHLATSKHWHMKAMKRTDTVTDRAQIKCWFKLPDGFTADDDFSVSFRALKYWNLAEKGITVRLFAAVDGESYSQQLTGTAAGYTFLRSRALDTIGLRIPTETADGTPITHLCMFMDFLPADPEKVMDVWLVPPVLVRTADDTQITGVDPQLHGALYTDTLNVVRPGAGLAGGFRKKLLGVGDSLMKGNSLNQHFSWLNIAGGALDMHVRNEGRNGSALAAVTGEEIDSVENRLPDLLDEFKPDYIIIQGGANDKRTNVPLDRFREAIGLIIAQIRTKRPGCKILFATNWYRTTNANDLGLYDWQYVQAMLEECEVHHVPCINNYADGLNVLADGVKEWADEGLVSGDTANLHFSKQANQWIADRYVSELMKM